MQHPEADVRAFVGPNADYYLQAWTEADPNGGLQALRWNWPAFFFNVMWMLYRRMYKYFFISLVALIGLGAVGGVVEALLGVPPGARWLDIPRNLLVAVFFGAYGSWFYYRHTNWKLAQTKAHHTDPEAIVNAGGVRPLLPALAVGVLVLLGFLAALAMPGLTRRP